MHSLFCDAIYGGLPPFSIGARLPGVLLTFPLFGLVRGVYLMNFSCAAKNECPELSDLSLNTELGWVTLSLYICAAAYLVRRGVGGFTMTLN